MLMRGRSIARDGARMPEQIRFVMRDPNEYGVVELYVLIRSHLLHSMTHLDAHSLSHLSHF